MALQHANEALKRARVLHAREGISRSHLDRNAVGGFLDAKLAPKDELDQGDSVLTDENSLMLTIQSVAQHDDEKSLLISQHSRLQQSRKKSQISDFQDNQLRVTGTSQVTPRNQTNALNRLIVRQPHPSRANDRLSRTVMHGFGNTLDELSLRKSGAESKNKTLKKFSGGFDVCRHPQREPIAVVDIGPRNRSSLGGVATEKASAVDMYR